MIGGAFQLDVGINKPTQSIGQFRSRGVNNRQMIKTGGTYGRRRAAGTFPRIQSNVVMISPSRQKGRLLSKALGQIKPKHVPIKSDCSLQIRDLQMHVTNSGLGTYRPESGR